MKNKSIIARLATSALIVAMTIGTVSSADSGNTNTSSVINVTTESTGIIKYDRNKNGAIDSDDVYFTAEDINSLAQSVNALSQNYEALNQKRLDIINAMNATVTKKFYSDSSKTRYDDYSGGADMATTGNLWDSASDDGALPTTASFDSIVQTLSTLTTPSTATATRYTATANGWLSGTSSDATGAAYTGTSSQATTLEEGVTSYVGLNASGESILTLGVNESLTLESGYYSDPVTINNGVVNRGTVNAVLTSANNTITLPAGYYNETVISTNATNLPGTITYHYGHHHIGSTSSGGGCYTVAKTEYYTVTVDDFKKVSVYHAPDGLHPNPPAGCQCGHCVGWTETSYEKSGSHQETRSRTTYSLGCGLNEKDEVRTDSVLNTKSNEILLSCEITY